AFLASILLCKNRFSHIERICHFDNDPLLHLGWVSSPCRAPLAVGAARPGAAGMPFARPVDAGVLQPKCRVDGTGSCAPCALGRRPCRRSTDGEPFAP